jgi:hypothetical protein
MACGGGVDLQPAIPDSPDGTVRAVFQGLIRHQPEIVWQALPPSYQQDAMGVIHHFADTVDPALFDRTVAVARKGVVVIQDKKELVLSSKMVREAGVDPATVDTVWEGTIHLLDTLLASDLANLERLRNLDVGQFLATTGRSLMDHAAEASAGAGEDESFSAYLTKMAQTEVVTVSEEGDLATVRLTPPGETGSEVPMVRVEGRWLPADLASRWPSIIETANAEIEAMNGEEADQTRVRAMFALGIAEGFIDQVDRMETADDFDAVFGALLGSFIQPRTGSVAPSEG